MGLPDIDIPERHRHTAFFVALGIVSLAAIVYTVGQGSDNFEALKPLPAGSLARTVSSNSINPGNTFVVHIEASGSHEDLLVKEKLPKGFSIVEGSARFELDGAYYILNIAANDTGLNYIVRVSSDVKVGKYEIYGIHSDSANTYSTGKTVVRVA
jgi:hypothetical protein